MGDSLIRSRFSLNMFPLCCDYIPDLYSGFATDSFLVCDGVLYDRDFYVV